MRRRRTAAVAELSRRVAVAVLAQLLDSYVSTLPYFYNVVVWLDVFCTLPSQLGLFLQQHRGWCAAVGAFTSSAGTSDLIGDLPFAIHFQQHEVVRESRSPRDAGGAPMAAVPDPRLDRGCACATLRPPQVPLERDEYPSRVHDTNVPSDCPRCARSAETPFAFHWGPRSRVRGNTARCAARHGLILAVCPGVTVGRTENDRHDSGKSSPQHGASYPRDRIGVAAASASTASRRLHDQVARADAFARPTTRRPMRRARSA